MPKLWRQLYESFNLSEASDSRINATMVFIRGTLSFKDLTFFKDILSSARDDSTILSKVIYILLLVICSDLNIFAFSALPRKCVSSLR